MRLIQHVESNHLPHSLSLSLFLVSLAVDRGCRILFSCASGRFQLQSSSTSLWSMVGSIAVDVFDSARLRLCVCCICFSVLTLSFNVLDLELLWFSFTLPVHASSEQTSWKRLRRRRCQTGRTFDGPSER